MPSATVLRRPQRHWPAARCRRKSTAPILSAGQGPDEHLLPSAQGPLHVSVKPMASDAAPDGRLVLVHDMSFITRRSEETKRYLFYFFMGLALVDLADHGDHRAAFVARLDGRHALPAARRRTAAAAGGGRTTAAARIQADRPRPAAADPRAGSGDACARRRPDHLDAGIACARFCTANCAARTSSWFPTASPTCISATASASRCSGPPAGWSRRWSPSCAPAPEPGSRTAAARPTARWSTGTTALRCRRKSPPTRSAASG